MNDSLLLITHPDFLLHASEDHPERPERLEAVLNALREGPLQSRIVERESRPAPPESLLRIHSPAMVETVRKASVRARRSGKTSWLDGDTYAGPKSYEIALLAAGAGIAAVDEIMGESPFRRAFCAVRPPGHHATPEKAMGFCLFNNVAICAAHLLEVRHLERVLIVDFDVHHGNGTQDAFYDSDRVFFLSAHQKPLYPGSGSQEESGQGKGAGYTLNLPMPPGISAEEYVNTWENAVAETMEFYRPEFILISAGFDGHKDDPLAGFQLREEEFGTITEVVVREAERHRVAGVVSFLEGGYDLRALAGSVMAHAKALIGKI